MKKPKQKVIVKKRVISKDKAGDKVARVMQEFKDGNLKTSAGEPVTDKKQALAIALSEAGLSKSVFKSFEKIEVRNKIRVMKDYLSQQIQKEEAKAEDLDNKIVALVMRNPNPKDEIIHNFAEQNGLQPAQVEERVYSLLSDMLGVQRNGTVSNISEEELRRGIQIEMEHTTNKVIAGKIATDHLTEIKNYYQWLTWMEDLAKRYESPEAFMKEIKGR